MDLANPYGEGNHHRMSWRRSWDVDTEGMMATHRDTGFALRFAPSPAGGWLSEIATPPIFGPDGEQAMAQIFGLRQLCKDGWDIWHTVINKTRQRA